MIPQNLHQLNLFRLVGRSRKIYQPNMLKLILFVTFLLNFQIISTIRIEPTYEIKDDFGGFGGSVIYSSYLPGQIIGIGHAVNSDDSDTDDSYRGGVDPSKIYLVSFNR